MRKPPNRDQLVHLFGVQIPLNERLQNFELFYGALTDLDEEIARQRKIVVRRDEEIEALKRKNTKLEADPSLAQRLRNRLLKSANAPNRGQRLLPLL